MSTQPIQNLVADCLWGPNLRPRQKKHLTKFLEVCEQEFRVLRQAEPLATQTNDDITGIIREMKSEPTISKSQMLTKSAYENDVIFDFVVRVVFMTATRVERIAGGGVISIPWDNNETISGYLDRVYCRGPPTVVQDQPVKIRNLRASTLMEEAGIEIKPTNKLSDHLHLMDGEDFKTLLVFHHCSFLEHCIKILRDGRGDLKHSTVEAVSCGCLHPQLLLETLKTLDLLFPKFGDRKSRKFLKKWVNDNELDTGMLSYTACISMTDQPPKDPQAFYEQYPYWGRRLLRLLREVDDPTPITWWQKYTERGRSPRRMFECAMAALIVTALSAFVATALAVVQVWIAYCAWEDAPSRSGCPSKVGSKGS